MAHDGIDGSTLIILTSDGMGRGPDALRRRLLYNYLTLLDESGMLPGAICLYTDAVRLTMEGSHVLDVLKSLEAKGVHLILCKTCLDFHGLLDQEQVGIVGGMTDVISAMAAAKKVITV